MPSPFASLAPVLVLLLPAVSMLAQVPKAAPAPFHNPERLGMLPEKLLPECSGIVGSRKHAGILWTHNDSGETPELFAVRGDGTVVRRLALPLANNFDWEDIALDAKDRLVVADIGDNFSVRTEIVLYRLAEPDPAAADPPGRIETFRFRYPPKAGPIDAEALFVRGDQAFLLTKQRQTARLFRLSLAGNGDAAAPPILAEALGKLDGIAQVTAANLADDGRHLALLTYLKVVVIDLEQPFVADAPATELLATLRQAARREQYLLVGQSEGITFVGKDLVVATEKGPFANGHPSLWRLSPQ